MRLIDADKIYSDADLKHKGVHDEWIRMVIRLLLDHEPTVDTAMSGHWIKSKFVNPLYGNECQRNECSRCGAVFCTDINPCFLHCPTCGARMDGD